VKKYDISKRDSVRFWNSGGNLLHGITRYLWKYYGLQTRRVPIHTRDLPDDVQRESLDDETIQRLRQRRGDQ
jgi:hypothetical protein